MSERKYPVKRNGEYELEIEKLAFGGAGVSPSLMEWLEQVPTVTEPLAESVRGLNETARCLGEGRDKLVALIEDLEASGRAADPGRIVIRQKAPRGPTR